MSGPKTSRLRAVHGRCWFIATVIALLLATGCGAQRTAAVRPTPTATPTVAQILAQADNAPVNDAVLTVTMQGSSLSGSGTDKFMRSPQRSDLTFTLTSASTTTSFEEIIDFQARIGYVKITQPGRLATDKWVKTQELSTLPDSSLVFEYWKVQNAKLVGVATEGGTSVWHIQGTDNAQGVDSTIDIYLRQDTYLPVRQEWHILGTQPVNVTYVYTAINTGLSITLPPPAEIQ